MRIIKDEAKEIINYITKFLNTYIPAQKTESEHTLKSYHISLKLYLQFLEENAITISNISYKCFDVPHIEQWLDWLMNVRKNKPQTVNNRLASLRVFLNYLGRQDISLLNLHTEASLIPRRKQPKIKVKGISKEAIKTLFNEIDQKTKTGRRDLAMFILIYNTGIRLNEVLSIKFKDLHLDIEKPYVSIIGKGNKLRSLYLLPKTVNYIRNYIKENHDETLNSEDYLFYSRVKGKQTKLTEKSIEKQLKKWATIANEKCKEIPVDLSPHQLRHSAACHWLDDGMNVVQISYLLGHEQLQTTMIYLEVTTAQKAKALEIIGKDNFKANEEKKWIKDITKLTDLCK